ncbi:MAG TPA: TonB-dependent receptor [Burkholderiales bacterium]|nr:TonB-dependent receptor [Burkholderiales bacterium]
MLSKDWQIQGMGNGLGFTAGLSYDYVDQNQLRSGSGKVSNFALPNAQEIEVRTRTAFTTLIADYQGTGWGVNMQLPYVDRYHVTYPQGTTTLDSSASSSLGDARVLGRFTGFSKDGSNGIFFGLKLPTGPASVNFASGAPLDASLQPGTGSTDILFGGFHQGQIDRLKLGWFLQGLVQHAISTRSDSRPGDAFNVNAGIRYAKYGQRITPMLQVDFIRRVSDSGANATPFITGGELVYLAPGFSVRFGNRTNVYAFVQLPVYQYVQGFQLSPTKIFSAGLLHSF